MKKQGCVFVLLMVAISLLSACVSNIMTGASLIYDRHHVYKQLDDFELSANAQQALYSDKVFKQPGCSIDVAVFNGDILVAGHVPSLFLRELAQSRLDKLTGRRMLFNELAVNSEPGQAATDSWITMKIRSQMFADSEIDPKAFKIITSDGIVYVMGDVRTDQAIQVLNIARNTSGVQRVVKLLNYYKLSEGPVMNKIKYSGLQKQATVYRPKPGSG